MSDAGSSHDKTTPLGDEAIAGLADKLLQDRKFLEAAEIFGQLASRNRKRTDLLARAHYARGMFLLSQGARTEARFELRRAVELDPDFDDAQTGLDEIHTSRLPRMGDLPD